MHQRSSLIRPGAGPLLGAVALLSVALAAASGAIGPASAHRATARPVSAAAPATAEAALTRDLDVYQGLGSWVDIYDYDLWDHPRATVHEMKALGVRTLYIETSNYKRDRVFMYPEPLAEFVDAAHASGMKVVAWYLPGFANLKRDFHRTMRAVKFKTPSGETFDSFALDIESPEVESPALRTQRLLQLSARIRAAVGADYTLGAIIPSPKGMRVHPDYWPGFPYRDLAGFYDAFLPMTYFTWRTSGEGGAHNYALRNVQIIRTEVGSRSVPIHVIGGISEESTTAEARGFVRAMRESGVIGASYYGFFGTTEWQWRQLAQIQVTPVQSPGLPMSISYHKAMGYVDDGVLDATHPREVFYKTGGRTGDWLLTLDAYDVQTGEVSMYVNWHLRRVIAATKPGQWSGDRTVVIRGSWLKNAGTNFIAFSSDAGYPNWNPWGVRVVSFDPASG